MMSKYLATITALLLLGASPIVYAQHSPPAGPEAAQIKIMQTVEVFLAGTQWQIKPLQLNSQQREEELPPKQPPKQQQQPKQPPKQGTYQQPPKQQQQPKQPPKQQQQPPMQQHEEHQQLPPKQQQPKQPPKQQVPYQQPQHEYSRDDQHYEYHHDWNRPDYQKLSWHKHHHHKRYFSPFRWYDSWDFWYDRYHYSDIYFFGMVYDDDWDWLFPGFYTYRWRDYERNDHGFYYGGKRITELILVFDPYDGLVGIGFMYKGIFIFLRDDMEEYYFDDEPTLFIVARILDW